MCGDGRAWEACIPKLVKAELLRVNEIETANPDDIVNYCEGVIKKPTAQLMIKYAKNDCRAIRRQKAELQR